MNDNITGERTTDGADSEQSHQIWDFVIRFFSLLLAVPPSFLCPPVCYL